MEIISGALGKGCLAGLGLAFIFFLIGGLVYFALWPFGLPRNLRLLIAIASGPIIGNALAFVVYWIRSRQIYRQMAERQHNETTAGDAS